jgi:hypothetical protein
MGTGLSKDKTLPGAPDFLAGSPVLIHFFTCNIVLSRYLSSCMNYYEVIEVYRDKLSVFGETLDCSLDPSLVGLSLRQVEQLLERIEFVTRMTLCLCCTAGS